jgi:hypothetical protein
MKNTNWKLEDEEKLRDLYLNQEMQDPAEIAEEFEGRNHRSIISKLVQMKIYIKPEKEPLLNHNTIKSLIKRLETVLDISLAGYNLSKKENLITLVEAIEEKCGQSSSESAEK